jgi:hypothetical protein
MSDLDQVCVCGHERRSHYGSAGVCDGPCLMPHQAKLVATVCSCIRFEPQPQEEAES